MFHQFAIAKTYINYTSHKYILTLFCSQNLISWCTKLGQPGTPGASYPGSFNQKPNYQTVKPSSSYPGSPGIAIICIRLIQSVNESEYEIYKTRLNLSYIMYIQYDIVIVYSSSYFINLTYFSGQPGTPGTPGTPGSPGN